MRNTKESTDTESRVVAVVVSELTLLSQPSRFVACLQPALCARNYAAGICIKAQLARPGDGSGSASLDSIQTHSLKDHRASKQTFWARISGVGKGK